MSSANHESPERHRRDWISLLTGLGMGFVLSMAIVGGPGFGPLFWLGMASFAGAGAMRYWQFGHFYP
jgi:hypothetical protein